MLDNSVLSGVFPCTYSKRSSTLHIQKCKAIHIQKGVG